MELRLLIYAIKNDFALLWENSNPLSSFSPQTIQIDLAKYKAVLVTIKPFYALTTQATMVIPKDNTVYQAMALSWTRDGKIAMGARNISANNSGITFGTGWDVNYASYTEDSSDHGIPIKVYGLI